MGPPLSLSTDGSYPATADSSLEITGLEEYNNYTISIAAVNSEGTVPCPISDTQQTLETGMVN